MTTTFFAASSFALCWGESKQPPSSHPFLHQFSFILSHQNDQTTWLADGLGRYQYGEHADTSTLAGEWDIGLKHDFTEQLSGQFYIQAQSQNRHTSQHPLNLVEWFLRYQIDFSFDHEIAFKLGQHFFPSSFENINPFWDTPYSLTYSSLNSWIGEEFRPIGLDLQYRYYGFSRKRLTVGASVFGGNDSMGALLAWRGWSYGRVKTGLGDVLDLPPLVSLAAGGEFAVQRDDGTRPFGKDLDGKPGLAIRSTFETEYAAFNLAWVDNLGDGRLHQGEYAWRTRFLMAGASFHLNDSFELISEVMRGNTRMGKNNAVDVDFYSAYLMLSYLYDDLRISLRHDRFASDDKDQIDQDNNDRGKSHTLAIIWQASDNYRTGIEFLFLESERERNLSPAKEGDENSLQLGFIFQYQL